MSFNQKYLLYLMMALVSVTKGLAQNQEKSYAPKEEMVHARENIDYSDDVIEKKKEKEKKEDENNSFNSPSINISDALGVLLIIVLIGVVIAILYFVLGNENILTPKSRKIKELNLQAVEKIEEDLENHDVAYYLKQAVEKKQFRIAIRLHYLLIIKQLSENKFINWKKDKTNRDYIHETSTFPFSKKFRSSTSIFEKVWYGERHVEEVDFNMIYNEFDILSKQINTKPV